MKNHKFLRSLFLVSLMTSLFAVSSYGVQAAATPSPTDTPSASQTKPSERWACLSVAKCSDPGSKCSGKGRLVHRTKLTTGTTKLIPNEDTYVMECVSTPQGPICTTGNADSDAVVFQGSANLSTLASLMNYKFEYFTAADGVTSVSNPVKSDANGDLGPYEWQSQSKFTTRKFLALNYVQPPAQSGQQNSQQQSTFDLNISDSNCLSVRYDPYGIIFDSQTLEPIPGANVTLYEKVNGSYVMAGNSTATSGIDPTQKTAEDGLYNFVVPPGTYKLMVASGGYNYPAAMDRVNQYYSKAYSNLYPAPATPTPGQPDSDREYEIIESSSIVHKDIPLDPVPYTANKRYPVALMDYFYQLKDKYSTILTVEGRVSHPYARIKVYTVAASAPDPQQAQGLRMLTTIQATKEGKFKFEIDQSTFNAGEKFGKITIEKVDMSNGLSWTGPLMKLARMLGAIVPKVEAQQSVNAAEVGFDPILNYVEGFAYDAKGNPLPNATVGVYLKFSEKPYSSVKTDDTGYFKITSEYLPFMPYELRYTSAAGVKNTVTTSDFVKENEAIIKTKSIDLYTFRNSKGETVTPTPRTETKGTNGTAGSPTTESPRSMLSNNTIMMLALVFFLAVVGILVAVYMMKNKKDTGRQI